MHTDMHAVLTTLESLAHAYEVQGNISAMHHVIVSARAIIAATSEADTPLAASWEYYLGVAYQRNEQPALAARCYRHALGILQATLGSEHEHTRIVQRALDLLN